MKTTTVTMSKCILLITGLLVVVSCADVQKKPIPPTKPQLLASSCPVPEYPKLSVRLNEFGTTGLQIYISAKGVVEQTNIAVSSGYERLDNAAANHFSKCQFKPGTLNGKPVGMWHQIKFVWRIEDAPAEKEIP